MSEDTFIKSDDEFLAMFNTEPPSGPYEGDFRRGYHQGAHAILEAIRDGIPIDQLERFIEGELRDWRSSPSSPAFPPVPKQDGGAIDDAQMIEWVTELDRGATMMKNADSEPEKLVGAGIISRTGQLLVAAGGVDLLRRAHLHLTPEFQRLVEVQWFGLTDADGNRWLP